MKCGHNHVIIALQQLHGTPAAGTFTSIFCLSQVLPALFVVRKRLPVRIMAQKNLEESFAEWWPRFTSAPPQIVDKRAASSRGNRTSL